MNIMAKLTPLVSQARKNAIDNFTAAEHAIVRFPRIMRGMEKKEVVRALTKGAYYVTVAIISLRTGKSHVRTVKNRELNSYGRAMATVGLVLWCGIILVMAHEMWARKRVPMTLEELQREFARAH